MAMAKIAQLASYFDLPADLLNRHVMRPLAEPYDGSRLAWDPHIPSEYGQLLAICDGVDFFGRESWDRFRLWGSLDFDADIMERSHRFGVFPIFGEVPHLASIKLDTGSVVATDWECEGDVEDGWLSPIAGTFREYVRTAIEIRESFGYDPAGMPADWWHPYAVDGTRYDLDTN